MTEQEKYYPKAENLGQECRFWDRTIGCFYPKAEMEGRRSCEGIIDDVCLFLKDGRRPKSLSEEQIIHIKIHPPMRDKSNIPPGDTTK